MDMAESKSVRVRAVSTAMSELAWTISGMWTHNAFELRLSPSL